MCLTKGISKGMIPRKGLCIDFTSYICDLFDEGSV